MKNDWEMAYINLIYCSICAALFTTRGRPGHVGESREEGGWEEREEIQDKRKQFLKEISRKMLVKSK